MEVNENSQQPIVPDNKGTNGYALAGFITSFIFNILGLIFSIVGLNQIKKTNERGKGFAIAGIIISSIKITTVIIIITISILFSGIIWNNTKTNVINGTNIEDYYEEYYEDFGKDFFEKYGY